MGKILQILFQSNSTNKVFFLIHCTRLMDFGLEKNRTHLRRSFKRIFIRKNHPLVYNDHSQKEKNNEIFKLKIEYLSKKM
jgi:hypothetical protein